MLLLLPRIQPCLAPPSRPQRPLHSTTIELRVVWQESLDEEKYEEGALKVGRRVAERGNDIEEGKTKVGEVGVRGWSLPEDLLDEGDVVDRSVAG